MELIRIIKQWFCKHRFVKHYDSVKDRYVYRCPKCGKINIK